MRDVAVCTLVLFSLGCLAISLYYNNVVRENRLALIQMQSSMIDYKLEVNRALLSLEGE